MLKIRLQRVGRIHEPTFRLVLTDSKNSTKSGRFEEVLGSYDPRKNTETFKGDRIKHWISQGVSITPTINNLLIKHGIIRGKKVHVSTVPPIVPVEEEVAEVAPAAETPVEAAPESTPESEPAVEAAPEQVAEAAPEATVEEAPAPEVTEEVPAPEQTS